MAFIISPILYLTKKKSKLLDKLYNYVTPPLFFNFLLRLVLESYIELILCTGINILTKDLETRSDYLSYYLSFIVMGICLLFPIFALVFIMSLHKKLQDDSLNCKFGSLYEDFNVKSRAALLGNFIFLVKRLIYIACCILLWEYAFIQVQVTVFIQILSMVYVATVKPFQNTLQNKVELMNEAMILLIMNHLFVFTEFVDSADYQYGMGFSIMVITQLTILANMFVLFRETIKNIISRLKIIKYRILRLVRRIIQRNRKRNMIDTMISVKAVNFNTKVQQMQKEGMQDVSHFKKMNKTLQRSDQAQTSALNLVNEETSRHYNKPASQTNQSFMKQSADFMAANNLNPQKNLFQVAPKPAMSSPFEDIDFVSIGDEGNEGENSVNMMESQRTNWKRAREQSIKQQREEIAAFYMDGEYS